MTHLTTALIVLKILGYLDCSWWWIVAFPLLKQKQNHQVQPLPLNIGQKQINIQEEQMTDRFGIIGASEIAGLLKEYKDNLLEEGFIDNDIHNKLRKMPSVVLYH